MAPDSGPATRSDVHGLTKAVNRKTIAGWTAVGLGIVALFVATIWNWQRLDDIEQVRKERRAAFCETQEKTYELLTSLVNESGNGSFDLTAVPSFANLDPATQRFFIDITSTPSAEPSFHDRALALIDSAREGDGCP